MSQRVIDNQKVVGTLHKSGPKKGEADDILLQLAGAPLKLRARSTLVHSGDQAQDVYYIRSGWLFRYQLLSDGRRQIFCFITPGDIANPGLIFSPTSYHSIGVLTQAEVMPIPRESLLGEIVRDAGFRNTLFERLARRERYLEERMIELGRLNALERMCVLIARLAGKVETEPDQVLEVPLTRELVSDALGLTAVHVSRTLRVLEVEGMVRWSRTSLRILDLQKILSHVPRNFAVHGEEDLADFI